MKLHRINRRQFLQMMAGTAAGAVAASCTPPAPPDPTAAPATAAPASSWQSPTFQGTLEYWDWAHPALRDHATELIAQYASQNPDIQINQTTLEWADYQPKALAAAASNTGPDFSQVHQIWKFDMIRAGYLAPFPEDLTDWDQKFSTPFNRDPDTGAIYNYTVDSVTDLMFFNTEILAAEGISKEDIPTNWDDFMRMAAQLTQRDGSGKITQVGMAFNDSYARSLHYFSLIYQLGGWVYGEDRASALWNTSEGVEALKFVQDIYHTHAVDDPVGLGSADAFGNGQAAFFFSFGYYASALRDRYPIVADVFDAVSTPTFSGTGDPAWGILQPDDGFVVSADAAPERQDAVFNFLAATTAGEQGEIGWYQAMESVPDWKPLADDPAIAELSHLEAQTRTMPWRVNIAENPSESDKFLQEMFDEVILNNGDLQAAADNATEQMNAAFASTADKKRYIAERAYAPPA